jgi:hypothetical protein
MQELIENIQSINGLIDFSIEPGYWQDMENNEVKVNLIIITHTFDAFKDPIYESLLEIYPESYDEYEDEEEYYISTFIDYEV